MSIHCWYDKNLGRMLLTCDSIGFDVVKRTSGQHKVTVSCPNALKKYTENMQAPDQFNHLMLIFLWVKLIHLQSTIRKLRWYFLYDCCFG